MNLDEALAVIDSLNEEVAALRNDADAVTAENERLKGMLSAASHYVPDGALRIEIDDALTEYRRAMLEDKP